MVYQAGLIKNETPCYDLLVTGPGREFRTRAGLELGLAVPGSGWRLGLILDLGLGLVWSASGLCLGWTFRRLGGWMPKRLDAWTIGRLGA